MLNLIFPLMAKNAFLLVMFLAGVMLLRSGLLRKEDSLTFSKIFRLTPFSLCDY